MNRFLSLVRRDVILAFRQGSASTMVVMFFILTVTLFPLGVGPEANILERMGPGVLWVTAMLASMLSLDRLFQADFEDGSLDLLALSAVPLEVTVLAKCLAHWITTGLPLTIIAPALGVLLRLDPAGYMPLVLTMLLGTPVLSLIGAIGAALTVGVRRGGVLLSLLVMPLYIPVLIFGTGAIDAVVGGLTERPHLLVLAAMLSGAIALCPWAAASALRLNQE